MGIQIGFVNRPTFALATQHSATAPSAPSIKNSFNSDAVKIQINSAASNQAAKAQSSNTNSVLNQFVTQVSGLTQQIKSVEGQLSQVAQGTSQYTALSSEKDKLEAQYTQATSLQTSSGQPSALGNLVTFLNTVGQSGGGASSLLNYGSSLIGAGGISALQGGGSAAAQKLSSAINTLVSSGDTIDQQSTQNQVEDAVSSIGQILGQGGVSQSNSGSSSVQVQGGPATAPIQVSELNLGQAQNLALSLRSVSPDDLIRAAVTGVNQQSVDALILKPPDPDNSKKKANTYQLDPTPNQTPNSVNQNEPA